VICFLFAVAAEHITIDDLAFWGRDFDLRENQPCCIGMQHDTGDAAFFAVNDIDSAGAEALIKVDDDAACAAVEWRHSRQCASLPLHDRMIAGGTVFNCTVVAHDAHSTHAGRAWPDIHPAEAFSSHKWSCSHAVGGQEPQ
jgi:hypothetical protein